MKTSPYFDQILFHNQSPATDQSYDEKSGNIFELDGDCSFVEIYVQPPGSSNLQYGKSILQYGKRLGHWEWVPFPEADTESTCSSPIESALAVDQSHYLRPDPPRYVGAPGLQLQKISDPKKLSQTAEVRLSACSMVHRADLTVNLEVSKCNFRMW